MYRLQDGNVSLLSSQSQANQDSIVNDYVGCSRVPSSDPRSGVASLASSANETPPVEGVLADDEPAARYAVPHAARCAVPHKPKSSLALSNTSTENNTSTEINTSTQRDTSTEIDTSTEDNTSTATNTSSNVSTENNTSTENTTPTGSSTSADNNAAANITSSEIDE